MEEDQKSIKSITTLVELLKSRASSQPNDLAYKFLVTGDTESLEITYQELDTKARAIASQLQQYTQPGDRALLAFAAGLDYIAAYFGCLYAAVIAIPVYPPSNKRHVKRLEAIVEDAQTNILLTSNEIFVKTLVHQEQFTKTKKIVITDQIALELCDQWDEPNITTDSLAFLQYTSGSTGSPKGVMVSHKNLLANLALSENLWGRENLRKTVSWLPIFHDLGLIGGILLPLYVGKPCVLMPPVSFIKNPYRWLAAISREKATFSIVPNFAYDLCVQTVTAEQIKELDLSSWACAGNGAEPIFLDTLNRFANKFSACGFRYNIQNPAYGMAEATLVISSGTPGQPARFKVVSKSALEENKIIEVDEEDPERYSIISSGKVQADHHLLIVDPDTKKNCGKNKVGELWYQGPSVTGGYLNKPELTEEVFHAYTADLHEGPFLRTGDLGFLDNDDYLFITGRLKDVIISNGRNIYPQDIEYTVMNCDKLLVPYGGAAFSLEENGSERLIIVQEVYAAPADPEKLFSAIRLQVSQEFDIPVQAIVFIKERTLLKTSSGKVQRRAIKKAYLRNELDKIIDSIVPTYVPIPAKEIEVKKNEDIALWIKTWIAARVGLTPDAIEVDKKFSDYGIDSIAAVRLTASLSDLLHKEIEPTIIWERPTIKALAKSLVEEQTRHSKVRTRATTFEPVAIIGMGCRFPGGSNSIEEFWKLLVSGKDAISEIPKERWDIDEYFDPDPDKPGKMYTRFGGFVDEIKKFDAGFFNISAREAEEMDPQQRLLLEVTWQALENAMIIPSTLFDTDTSIYIGISTNDYLTLFNRNSDLNHIDAYHGTGSSHSTAAGRLAYFLGTHGACMAIDTACSSSMVAINNACMTLQTQQSAISIVGGANAILIPDNTINFCRAKMLAPDGRCKTFDSRADGYARGEGCGVIVLKRLTDAIKDNDRIYSIIRSCVVNQDGASNGLTAPNSMAQKELLKQALQNSGIDGNDISYVEAHGTGTPLGDPIEVEAIQRVYGENRQPSNPLILGSVKTNIGHLEGAAGIAGVIKTALSLHHKIIPKHLHFAQPNPHIHLDQIPAIIPTENITLPFDSRAQYAGVSSFGFSGTNAHVILEGVGRRTNIPNLNSSEVTDAHVIAFSAKNKKSLRDCLSLYAEYIQRDHDFNLENFCYSKNIGRPHFKERIALSVKSREELVSQLNLLAQNDIEHNHAINNDSLITFLYTGQGSQYLKMGDELYQKSLVFQQTFDKCAMLAEPYLDIPLKEVIQKHQKKLDDTRYTQPALFAIEYSLTALWKSIGIEPDLVMGHSVGEYVAACVAGIMSLSDAMKLICVRGKLISELSEDGAMLVVFSDISTVQKMLTDFNLKDTIDIAAINTDTQIVLSGAKSSISSISEKLLQGKIRHQQLNISHAFHSRQLAPIQEAFYNFAAQCSYHAPKIPLISNKLSQIITDASIDANYWKEHLLEPVYFAQGIELARKKSSIFIEIGPKPILLGICQQQLNTTDVAFLATINPGKSEWEIFLNGVCKLYQFGKTINWESLYVIDTRQKVDLPYYPFQRQSYWIETIWPNQDRRKKRIQLQDNIVQGVPTMIQNPMLNNDSNMDLAKELREIIGKCLKQSPHDLDDQATFLEIGADSILLMEIIKEIDSQFKINLDVRQLFDETNSISKLENYLQEHLPEQKSFPAPFQVPQDDHTNQVTNDGNQSTTTDSMSSLEKMFSQQLHSINTVIEKQLDIVRNISTAQTPLPVKPQPSQQPHATRASEVTQKQSTPITYAKALTPPQQKHLEQLITRYNTRTLQSKNQIEKQRKQLTDPRSATNYRDDTKELNYSIVFNRGKGSKIWDIDGNEYVDIAMGMGVSLFGHTPPFIVDAIQAYCDDGLQVGPISYLSGKLASLFCELTGQERVHFANSGTEAVMTAVRAARGITKRNKIVIFSGSYHGHSDVTLAVAKRTDSSSCSIPATLGVPQHTVDDVLVLAYGKPESLDIIKQNAGELAAVIVEPVQSRQPNLQPKEFMQALREITQQLSIILIMDEVITGFRADLTGAQGVFGIDPDITTYGKVIGGGLPIGMVAGKAKYMDILDGGRWQYGDNSSPNDDKVFAAGTFSRNPLTVHTTLATLEYLKQQGKSLYEKLNQRTQYLADTLNHYFQQNSVPIVVQYFSSLFRFVMGGNVSYLYQPLEMELFHYHLIEKGIYVWEGRTCFLSTAHSDEDIEKIIQAVKASVAEMTSAGFFFERARSKVIPLLNSQQQLLRLSQLSKAGSLAYHVPITLRVSGRLDITRLHDAVLKIIERHEALRTIMADNGHEQIVLENMKIDLPFYNLSTTDGKEYKLSNDLLAVTSTPFDLTNGPLCRVKVYQLTEEEYVILFVAHHIICDGWSMGICIQDLIKTYQGDDINCKTMQWSEYVSWHEENLKSKEYLQHEEFWINQFSKDIPYLQLPLDRICEESRTYQGGRKSQYYTSEFTGQLHDFAKQHNLSLFMLLMGAYNLLLHKLSGQYDFVVGIPTHGRGLKGSNDLVGYCAHLLAIRSQIDSANISVNDYLLKLKAILLISYQHQDYPFSQLLDHLKSQVGDLSQGFASAIFNLDRTPILDDLSELSITINPLPVEHVPFQLSLNVIETGSGLLLDWDYQTSHLTEEIITRWQEHFYEILKNIMHDPTQMIADLSILTTGQRQQLLVAWNDTQREYQYSKFAIDYIEDNAQLRPEKIAVVDGAKKTTYAVLNDQANRLAHYLVSQGVIKGDIVLIHLPRGLDFVVAVIASLKIAATYLPISLEYPEERVNFIIEESKAKFVISPEVMKRKTKQRKSVVNPVRELSSDDVAYVIYTSGSTGKPKGVMVSQSALRNLINWHVRYYELNDTERGTQFADSGFDAAVWEIFPALVVGAEIHIIHDDLKQDVVRLNDYYLANKISYTFFPTPYFEIFHTLENNVLKKVQLGGDRLKKKYICSYQLYNNYGPAENAVVATSCEVDSHYQQGSIGKPVDNCRIYILNEHLQPQPIGVPGEIYLAGDSLANGYLFQPELTNQKFIIRNFAGHAERLYKTGDLALWLADGNIKFIGREDSQVKINGKRVELGEVESVLNSHPDINEAIVVTSPDHSHLPQLVAYLETKNITNDFREEIRLYLSNKLPAYMLPKQVVLLEKFPQTTNGKIDRKALPVPDFINGSRSKIQPRNEVEQRLAEIWQVLLNVSSPSIDDNFFELGGDSLRTTHLMLKINQNFEVNLETSRFFQRPTIESLAKFILNKSENLEPQVPTLLRDAQLNDIIVPKMRKGRRNKKHVFLTGATGFLGVHLITQLLKDPKVILHCLVRANDENSAMNALRNKIDYYQLNDDVDFTRLVPLVGDLGKPRLGLAEEQFDKLTRTIDSIYHNGAQVHHVYDYQQLKKANVMSTREIIKLASVHHRKPIHYISTLSAAFGSDNSDTVLEKFPEEMQCTTSNGYIVSKWVSECLLKNAHRLGFPIHIYRLCQLVGNTQTGITPTHHDHFMMFLKGVMQIGYIPQELNKLDILPVDFVAEAIVKISCLSRDIKEVYHISNPSSPSFYQVVDWINSYGYPIKRIPYNSWLQDHLAKINESNALYSVLPLYFSDEMRKNLAIDQQLSAKVSCDNTLNAFQETKQQFPVITSEIFYKFIDFAIEWFDLNRAHH